MGGADPRYAVAILGGGVAGCATALALARRHGIGAVLVVEGGASGGSRVGESIPPDTRLLLEALGVWQDFLAEGHEPCVGSCSSWGSDEPGYNDFLFNPHGHGWHLDRRRFDAFLARQVRATGAELRSGIRYRLEEAIADGFRLRLADAGGAEKTVTARYVVDATGKTGRFARRRGAKRLWVDQLVFATGFFEEGEDSAFSSLTRLEAVEYGWWYGARLPGGRLVLSVASDGDLFRRLGLGEPVSWQTHLAATRHLAPLLEDCRFVEGSLGMAVAPSFVLDRPAGSNWLAVGDAASSYDPISSQGIHKALSNAVQAARAIADCLRGEQPDLAAYATSLHEAFADYLRNRAYFYGIEARWPDAPFWTTRRRRSGRHPVHDREIAEIQRARLDDVAACQCEHPGQAIGENGNARLSHHVPYRSTRG